MFTGIIQKVAKVLEIKPIGVGADLSAIQLKISNPYAETQSADPIQLGESIANNGVCLTVTAFTSEFLQFDLSPATLEVTALSRLKPSSKVNLERSLRMGDRLSGHWVQGHVDGTAEVVKLQQVEKGFYDLVIRPTSRELLKYCVKKGSLTVEGISLTIQDLQEAGASGDMTFQIIPHTWAETALNDLKKGDFVNIEVDLMAKYLERMTEFKTSESHSTKEQ